MPRPALASEADIKQAIGALCAESSLPARAVAPMAFRRVVSVRKVRERLGGGNPATIGRVINAVEQEITAGAAPTIALPALPPDVAALMESLWRAAVDVQLLDVERLREDARSRAERASAQVTEAALRADMLQVELTELRAALRTRDERVAQLSAELAAERTQGQALSESLRVAQQNALQWHTERQAIEARGAAAVAAALERYDGLSQRLLEETAQQRQTAQAEVARMSSQLKFAEKRQASLDARIEQLATELQAAHAQTQAAVADTQALRYANATLQTEIDSLRRLADRELRGGRSGLPRARKRPALQPRRARTARQP